MGVQGLWSILNCTGKDIDLSTLEGKILAIDLSIWLNQALKSSNESPNAHLQILFNRICKLLFYKIKPVFVFDGPTPSIKRHALEMRRKIRQQKNDRTEVIRSSIINILMKKNLIDKKRVPVIKVKDQGDIFQLADDQSGMLCNWTPALESEFTEIAMDYISHFSNIDDVDIESQSFLSLPLEVQHEILRTVSKEKRYGWDTSQNSYNDMKSKEFSDLQIKRLIERIDLHNRVDNLKSTMNDRDCRKILNSSKLNSLGDFTNATVSAKRIISHDTGYLMLIDPLNDDFIKSLSESKKEAMLKGIKRKPCDEELPREKCDNSFEESDNLLDEQDLCSMMKCVSKFKKNIKDAAKSGQSNISSSSIDLILPTEDDDLVENKIIYTQKSKLHNDLEELNNVMDISIKTAVSENGNLADSLPQPDTSEGSKQSEEIKNVMDIGITTSVSENENITNLLPQPDTSEGSKEPDRADSLEDDDSESDSDFVDVSDKEENNCEEQTIEETDAEKTLEYQKLIYSSVLNELGNLSQLHSLHQNSNRSSDLDEIITDRHAWNTAADKSLLQLYEEEQKLENQSVPMSERYFQEAKELLKLFGIPFVESLAEAEAQCAFLESAGLTDGTITEDSDIWLFGGRTVYKHIFTRGFYAREYNSRQIHKKLGLNRDLMICIAMLSGGDYTPGIYGVGPVNAMEILAEFSDPDVSMTNFQVLELFKNWSVKHKKNVKNSVTSERKRFLRFDIEESFPERSVYDAYNQPLVDQSHEPFIWNPPSAEKLIEYGHTRIGWEKLKIIEMLETALRSNSKSSLSQKKITDFFDERVDDCRKLPSKRLKLATMQRNLIARNYVNKS